MRKRLASVAALAAVAVLVPVAASDAAQNDGSPNDPRAKAFVKEVSVDRVERHQQRLQEIATANGGTRDVFGTGYTASLDYVVRVLENAGYNPQVTPFNFPFWEETAAAGPQPGHADGEDLPARHRRRRATRPTSTSSPSAARPRRRSTTCRSCRSAASRSRARGGIGERLRSRRLSRRRRGRGRADPARHLPVRRQDRARAVEAGAVGRDHLQRGQHAGAPERRVRRPRAADARRSRP